MIKNGKSKIRDLTVENYSSKGVTGRACVLSHLLRPRGSGASAHTSGGGRRVCENGLD